MFTTVSDFDKQPYSIPNAQDDTDLPAKIDAWEEDLLRPIFGNSLYTEFLAGLAALPAAYDDTEDYAVDAEVLSPEGTKVYKSLQTPNEGQPLTDATYWEEVPNKWLALQYGSSYSYSNNTYTYAGLKSFLKPYIYYEWLRWNIEYNSGVGIVVPEHENAVAANPKYTLVQTYNRFVGLLGRCYRSCFYGFSFVDSFYGYLKANPTDYPGITYLPYSRLNEFDF